MIPTGATDFAWVIFSDPEFDYEGELGALVANTHKEIVGQVYLGPGWEPGELYAFAYTKPSPGAREAVRIHQEANEGVSDD